MSTGTLDNVGTIVAVPLRSATARREAAKKKRIGVLVPYRFPKGHKPPNASGSRDGVSFTVIVREILGEAYVRRFALPDELDKVSDRVTVVEILAERIIGRALQGDSYCIGVLLDRIDPLPKGDRQGNQKIVVNMIAEQVKLALQGEGECQGNGTSGAKRVTLDSANMLTQCQVSDTNDANGVTHSAK